MKSGHGHLHHRPAFFPWTWHHLGDEHMLPKMYPPCLALNRDQQCGCFLGVQVYNTVHLEVPATVYPTP